MRPTSRAGGGPSLRPGTGQTGNQQGLRPGSAARVPTAARLGTGMGPIPGLSGAPGTAASRPGTGRLVQDATYFIGMVRSKCEEIYTEIARMKQEIEKSARDGTVGAALEKKYESLLKEVRGLEGDLADYNLAMDKARSNVDVSEIQGYHLDLKRRNESLSREIDQVFLERQERERGAARFDEAIAELQRAAESRISSLPAAQVAQYRQLADANRELSEVVTHMQAELESINLGIESAEANLRRDTVRDEYAVLEKRLAVLVKEQAALEEEMEATSMDPSAAREKLLGKVREENGRLNALDKQLSEAQEANEVRRKQAAELTKEIEDRKNDAGDSSKYEQLFKRDAEMSEFIDRFPDMRAREVSEHRQLGDAITQLLERMSEAVEREAVMPSATQAEEMKEDLAEKQKELYASEMTADRLREELSLRQSELEKIATLDTKIAQELEGVRARMAAMQDDLVRFADLDGLRKAGDESKRRLQSLIQSYHARREAARPALNAASGEFEKKRGAAARDSQAQAIEALEAKIKAQEQAVFQLKEFIASKGQDSDYVPVKNAALKLVTELNVLIQRQVVEGVPS